MHSFIRARVREIFDEIMQSEKHEKAQDIDPSSLDIDTKHEMPSESSYTEPLASPDSDIPNDASILQQITPVKT